MEDVRIYPPSGKAVIWGMASVIALLFLLLLNKLIVTETGLLHEGAPRFTSEYIACALVTALLSACLCLAIINWRKDFEPARDLGVRFRPLEKLLIGAALATAGGFFLMFLVNPPLFNMLSLEDGIVEWASALLLLVASAVCVLTFLRLKKSPGSSLLTRVGVAVLALVFFVIGMEEISWLQRVLGIEPGPMFETNIQGEMNFHNFATEPVEIAYFFGAFALTVLLPFMRSQGVFPLDKPVYAYLVPRPFVLYIGALACALNFDMWNIFTVQIGVFSSLFILAYMMLKSRVTAVSLLSAGVLGAVLVSQWGFLSFPGHYAREWEITEYKEFLIPLAFLAYSLDMFRLAGQTAPGRRQAYAQYAGEAVSSRG